MHPDQRRHGRPLWVYDGSQSKPKAIKHDLSGAVRRRRSLHQPEPLRPKCAVRAYSYYISIVARVLTFTSTTVDASAAFINCHLRVCIMFGTEHARMFTRTYIRAVNGTSIWRRLPQTNTLFRPRSHLLLCFVVLCHALSRQHHRELSQLFGVFTQYVLLAHHHADLCL